MLKENKIKISPTHLSSTLQKRSKPPAQSNFRKELAKPTLKETSEKKVKINEMKIRKPAENTVYKQWRVWRYK